MSRDHRQAAMASLTRASTSMIETPLSTLGSEHASIGGLTYMTLVTRFFSGSHLSYPTRVPRPRPDKSSLPKVRAVYHTAQARCPPRLSWFSTTGGWMSDPRWMRSKDDECELYHFHGPSTRARPSLVSPEQSSFRDHCRRLRALAVGPSWDNEDRSVRRRGRVWLVCLVHSSRGFVRGRWSFPRHGQHNATLLLIFVCYFFFKLSDLGALSSSTFLACKITRQELLRAS